MSEKRIKDLIEFYGLLGRLEKNIGGGRKLADCDGRMEWQWPERGVYFFKESGEARKESGEGLRIVRVGITKNSLGKRLRQHKGTKAGGGSHGGSIFRRYVCRALIEKNGYNLSKGNLEEEVSSVIGNMPFLWLEIGDKAGRRYIEKNSIALLSNQNKSSIDPPSSNWLGKKCDRERVRNSGLWNNNYVGKDYDPGFLCKLKDFIAKTKRS